jgi:hypothetical protein
MEINLSQAKQHLLSKGIQVTKSTIGTWIEKELLAGWKAYDKRYYTTTEDIDFAIGQDTIPPKTGSHRRYTDEQKAEMCVLKAQGWTLEQIAQKFGCDQSYVSLVYRGKR